MPEEQSVHAARRESEREISPGHRAQLPVQQPCAHMHLHCMHARAHIRSRILLPPSLSPSFSRRTVYALDISLSLSLLLGVAARLFRALAISRLALPVRRWRRCGPPYRQERAHRQLAGARKDARRRAASRSVCVRP